MPVQFILGRAGSGKTRHGYQRIIEQLRKQPLGPNIYLLVPRQATFQAQRELACGSGITGFTRLHVLSLDELGIEILQACGDVGIPQVTALGRQMILGSLLRRLAKDLRFYGQSAHRPGLALELDSTFAELERCGMDPQAVDDLLQSAGDDSPVSLRDKLHDVQKLYSEYNKFIGSDRLDPRRRLQLVLRRVRECGPLKDAQVFVDDFLSFSDFERKLLAGLATVCGHMEIALLMDPASPVLRDQPLPDNLSTFHRSERAYLGLRQVLRQTGAQIETPVLLNNTFRFSPPLARLEAGLFVDGAMAPDASNDCGPAIEFVETPDLRGEVDAAARRILLAIHTHHLRLRDIAVLVRDLDEYHDLIDASFREHGIRLFADRRRTAGHHPLLQFIRASLHIALSNWPHDAVMTLLKTGLAGVGEDEAAELENYVVQHRLRGSIWARTEPWGFKRELTAGNEDTDLPAGLLDTSRIDAARRGVAEKLLPFIQAVSPKSAKKKELSDAVTLDSASPDKRLNVRSIMTALFTALESFGVRRQFVQWMQEAESAGHFEQRDEHSQVWEKLVELFEHMDELLGEEVMPLQGFIEILENGLEGFDLALTPPTVDQVLVGAIDRTRVPEVKLVLVLGLSQGQFPRTAREGSVLSDRDRRFFRKHNVDLDPETERRQLDERLLGYLAFTRASQWLWVSRPVADDAGRPLASSPFWQELRRLAPSAAITNAPRPGSNDLNAIGTPRQLVTSLMRWAKSDAVDQLDANNQDTASSAWPALYQWLATHDCCDDAIDIMRYRAWRALDYTNIATLSTTVAKQLFPTPLPASDYQLESFAACPFQHFAGYGLQLQSADEPDVTAIDLSRVYHRVLADVVADAIRRKQEWCELSVEQLAGEIDAYVNDAGRKLRGELMLGTARSRHLLDYAQRMLKTALASYLECSRQGEFRPGAQSISFGSGEKDKLPALPLATPKGRELRLSGRIDRIDFTRDRDEFIVMDYRLRSSRLPLGLVFHGLRIRPIVALQVVQAFADRLNAAGSRPAAALELSLLRNLEKVSGPNDDKIKSPDSAEFHLASKMRGMIHRDSITRIDRTLAPGVSSKFLGVSINKDGKLGKIETSDALESEAFSAVLAQVILDLGKLGDRLIDGEVSVSPYWLGSNQTPCPRCAYRSVCRFEPGINKYRSLAGMKQSDVVQRLVGDQPVE